MGDPHEVFEARYRRLAVVTCEWRAYGVADPEALADAVFAQLRARREAPDLRRFYRAVETVVDRAYRDAAGQRSLLEGLVAGSTVLLRRGPRTDDDVARAALVSLPAREVDLLRQAHWDELTPEEMAEINGRDAATQRDRAAQALRDFAAKLPAALAADPAATMRALHPGTHRRSGDVAGTPAPSDL